MSDAYNSEIEKIEKLYNELSKPDVIQCMRCGVKMNSFFADFKFCPVCRAPRFSAKEAQTINDQIAKAKPRKDGGSLIVIP